MSALWIPGAIRKPLPIDRSRDPFIVPVGDIFHVAVSEAESLFDNFHGRGDGIESTGYIRRDGTIEEYRPLNVECDAQGDGNSFALDGKRCGFNSWETQGGEFGEWTDAQIASMKHIIAFKHQEYGTPLRLCPAWDAPGSGYHRLFDRWNKNGHTCPGPDRVKQFHRVIVPWMDQGAPTQEDDMTPAQEQLLKDAAANSAKAARDSDRAVRRGQIISRQLVAIAAGRPVDQKVLDALAKLDAEEQAATS